MKLFISLILTLITNSLVLASPLRTNITDQETLLSLKSHITSDPNGILQTWDPNTNPSFCNWEGVLCNATKRRVTGLTLGNLSLSGTISPHITNLSFLHLLDLQNNSFHGILPRELGRLFRLQTLLLDFNSIHGTIPSSLSRCSRLRVLSLSNNNFQGSIPSELGNLSQLQDLSFSKNNLTGTIPPSFGNCSSLVNIILMSNNLHGFLPDELGKLHNLLQLQVGDNHITGGIPSSLFNLSSLLILGLAKNRISGRLPYDIFTTLPKLETLFVGGNLLEGPIPSSISNASRLFQLDLSVNNFTGQIPIFRNVPNIEILSLESNHLDSYSEHGLDFITSLGNSTFLRVFSVAMNQLTGQLPSSIGNLTTQLALLVMGGNYFEGNVPEEIGKLGGLIQLSLESNFFTGSIPSTIGNLKNLQKLTLHSNHLSRSIPISLGRLTEVYEMDLSNNNLTGNIPSSLSKCQCLQSLDLSLNNLDGHIPKEIFSYPNLGTLLNLSWNSLTGSLPSQIGNLETVQEIDLSNNQLSGTIPVSLGDCSNLLYLDLASNSFERRVPDSLAKLKGIEYIDLSSNKLSGTLPSSLESLQFLQTLNLSHNQLYGEIPKKGIFLNSSGISVNGNPELCGGIPKFQLPECVITKRGSGRSRRGLVLGLVIGSIALCIVLVLGFLFTLWSRKGKRKVKQQNGDSTKCSQRLYSYYDLRAATDNFNKENMIGEGSFGSVFKGVLRDGTTVAIKVFKMEQHGAIKSFFAECEALRSVRHRNLVKIITICSTNDFKALVLKFMPNRSLENWLHNTTGWGQESSCLNLQQRLDIAIDVASAMVYLHHESGTPVVHCDLKPSNVLLDEDMTAHVGDFGLARIVCDISQNFHQSSTLGLKGSIGYIAPEYGLAGGVSTKGDVYSYGVLLLEMFTGRKPTSASFKDGSTLQNWVASMLPDRLLEVLDVDMVEDSNLWGINVFAYIMNIGLSCAAEIPEDRPSMRDVYVRINKAKKMIYNDS